MPRYECHVLIKRMGDPTFIHSTACRYCAFVTATKAIFYMLQFASMNETRHENDITYHLNSPKSCSSYYETLICGVVICIESQPDL